MTIIYNYYTIIVWSYKYILLFVSNFKLPSITTINNT